MRSHDDSIEIQYVMMTSSNGKFSALLTLGAENSPVTGEFPSQRPLISAWTKGWVNNHEAGDLRRHRAHYDVTVMKYLTNRDRSVDCDGLQHTCTWDMITVIICTPGSMHAIICYMWAWRHHDVAALSASLALCEGNPSVISRFALQTDSIDELWYFRCC